MVTGDEHDAQGHHCDYYDERTVQECGISTQGITPILEWRM